MQMLRWYQRRYGMRIPLMPQGVEHMHIARIAPLCRDSEDSIDAARR